MKQKRSSFFSFFPPLLSQPASPSACSAFSPPPFLRRRTPNSTLPKNVSAYPKTLAGEDRLRPARAPLALLGRGHRCRGRRGPDLGHVRLGVGIGLLGCHRAERVGVGRLVVLLRDVVARKTTVPTTTRRRFFLSVIGRSATTGAARRGGKKRWRKKRRAIASNDRLLECFARLFFELDVPGALVPHAHCAIAMAMRCV